MIKSFIIESKWESTNILPILLKKLVISIIIYSKKNIANNKNVSNLNADYNPVIINTTNCCLFLMI